MKPRLKETELTDREFEEILDDIYGDVDICGITYSAGYALRMLDEVAFNEARNNYTDSTPVWICDNCEEEFDNEEAAEECCKENEEEG